jgi:dihydrofolate reductase
MRRVIAAMNMTLDGYCDQTYGIADEELHDHYSDLLSNAGTILYGRITYQLMQYWQEVLEKPSAQRSENRFAEVIDRLPKVVFSHTLKDTGWKSARLASGDLKEEVLALRKEEGKDILVGSPSLIVGLTQLGLIDEYQICIHPIIAGKGLVLFKDIHDKITLKLLKTKTFRSGAIVMYYRALRQ